MAYGAEGEDGRIQSMLSLEHIPFTGSGHTGSAIAMDKFASTLIAQSCKYMSQTNLCLKIMNCYLMMI